MFFCLMNKKITCFLKFDMPQKKTQKILKINKNNIHLFKISKKEKFLLKALETTDFLIKKKKEEAKKKERKKKEQIKNKK